MNKISLFDIDFSKLKRMKHQGATSTTYVWNAENKCIKMLNKMETDEIRAIYLKFLEMDGLKLDGVLMPIDLIMSENELVGYTMPYFKKAQPLSERYSSLKDMDYKAFLESMKQVSIILKNIHQEEIIYRDVSFKNILINPNGEIQFCDFDSCQYKNYYSYYVSPLFSSFIFDYHCQTDYEASFNTDRISLFLSFIFSMYDKRLQDISFLKYNSIAKDIQTLKNAKQYVKSLKKFGYKTYVPYLDELIDEKDCHILKKNLKQ